MKKNEKFELKSCLCTFKLTHQFKEINQIDIDETTLPTIRNDHVGFQSC